MTRALLEGKLAVLQFEHRQLVSQMLGLEETHERLKADKLAFEGAIEFAKRLIAEMDNPATAVIDASPADPPKE